MRILITGICGFAGSTLAYHLRNSFEGAEISGFDNFMRPGSEVNRLALRRGGIRVRHADQRCRSDMEALPAADWIVDAAAIPSVLAGVGDQASSRQLVEHNLYGTINLLEYCKMNSAGLIMLSTSRVYSIEPLAHLEMEVVKEAYVPVAGQKFPQGITSNGVSEAYATSSPLSLYGSTKLASECMALEYGSTFDFPVWINRCGVMAGAGQFGQAEQGIFSFWINSWLRRRPLSYIGFDGRGRQVRDCLHPRDLVPLLHTQITHTQQARRVYNVSGGRKNSISLAQLSAWCADRFGERDVVSIAKPRPFDLPWMILDSANAKQEWDWQATISLEDTLMEIADHAERNPDWLDLSAP